MKMFFSRKAIIVSLIAAATVSTSAVVYGATSAQQIDVLVNAKKVDFPDTKPAIVNSSVLVPIRFVGNELGATLTLNGMHITVKKGDRTVGLDIGSKVATVNGSQVKLGVSSMVKNNRSLVPLRFISEGLGLSVKYVSSSRSVWIGSAEAPDLKGPNFEEKDITDFKKYFGKDTRLFLDRSTVTLFDPNDLPIHFNNVAENITVLKIWKEIKNGKEYIKMQYTGKHLGIYYLTGDGVPRKRYNQDSLRTKNSDGSFTMLFAVKSYLDEDIPNWEDLKLKDIKYIGFLAGDSGTLPLMKNSL